MGVESFGSVTQPAYTSDSLNNMAPDNGQKVVDKIQENADKAAAKVREFWIFAQKLGLVILIAAPSLVIGYGVREVQSAYLPPKFNIDYFVTEGGLNKEQAMRLIENINVCAVKSGTTTFCKFSPLGRALRLAELDNRNIERLETSQAIRPNFPPGH